MEIAAFSSWEAMATALQQVNMAQVRVQVFERADAFVNRSPEEEHSLVRAWVSEKVKSELRYAGITAARHHFELFFASEPSLWQGILSVNFGRPDDAIFRCKSEILEKIDRKGLHGYLELLVAAVNQHWSTAILFETYAVDANVCDDDAVKEHLSSLQLVAGVLDFIERDPWVMARFRSHWERTMPRHPLDGLRATVLQAVIRWKPLTPHDFHR